ncbi:MAG: hypothetical protein F4Y98_07510 [Chloroflexi bacterium]|nr:hypothetical protein [Chloroflexota bacterium]
MNADERRAALADLLLEQHDAECDLRLLARRVHVLGERLRAAGESMVRAMERRDGVPEDRIESVDWESVPATVAEYNATLDTLARIRDAIGNA